MKQHKEATGPEKGKRTQLHRWIMLFCGTFMTASGLAAAYLAFSVEGGIPGILLASHPIDPFNTAAYHLPISPAKSRPAIPTGFWKSWSPETFALARRQNRLLLINWTASWSHECHLMDEITYDDPEVRRWIFDHAIPVRVDSDIRPDLARYIASGWPTTALLLPTGETISSGTFMPPKRFIAWGNEVFGAWKSHPADILAASDQARRRAETAREKLLRVPADPWSRERAKRAADQEMESLSRDFDRRSGGFGRGRKFPSPQINRFLMERLAMANDSWAEHMLRATLDGELRLLDSVWGGLFRYSETSDWRSPRYEKLLEIQAQAIDDLASAFALTKDERYRTAAERIEGYAEKFLKRDDGLYSVGEDADLRRQDGSWIEGSRYYRMTGFLRSKLGRPFVVRPAYTSSNAELAAALLIGGERLGHREWVRRGMDMLDALWKRGVAKNGQVRHGFDGTGLGGLFQDELALARAELIAFWQSRDARHLKRLHLIDDFIRVPLSDPASGGYRVRVPFSGRPGGPEEAWPGLDPDLTASLAMLWADEAALDHSEWVLKESQRLSAWVATHPELVDPAIYARLALRNSR